MTKSGTRLRNRIRHAPISGDLPRLNHIVSTLHAVCMVIVCRPVKEFGELLSRWLDLTQFIRAPRLEHAFLSFPPPGHTKPSVRHSVWYDLEVGRTGMRAPIAVHAFLSFPPPGH